MMKTVRPWLIAGRLERLAEVRSVGVLRMSPRRSTDTRICWKSCHSCAMRRIGEATRPASMLKAIKEPIDSSPPPVHDLLALSFPTPRM